MRQTPSETAFLPTLPAVAIRVDSGHKIGSGHVRRCLSLAAFLKRNGFGPVFICRDIPGANTHIIEQAGFELVLLPDDERFAFSVFSSTFSAADFENMVQDAERSADAFARQYPGVKIAWVVSDHMMIREPWQARFAAKTGCMVLAIDGQANTPHHADVLVDPQISENPAEKWAGLLPDTCVFYSGPSCLPLSQAFESARERASIRSGPVKRVLVCFGGTDIQDLVYRAVQTLVARADQTRSSVVEIDIAVPSDLPSLKRLEELVVGYSRCRTHVGLNDLSSLMLSADLAIGGGGIMLWERCLLGLPAIVVPLAENQEKPIERLEAKGAVISVGSPDEGYESGVEKALRHISQNPEALCTMSSAAFEVMSDWPQTDDWLNVMKGCNNE
ncbi:UDP-2,4-diacetamido-2,4,6-trideoxy-beta-L-altropyranose hydrolase [Marinobacter sp. MDS2]|uniref:UDP-2,4-diacetamido-2,4, 6-trideoxy-beta-L-altropyranose hydrolase n=1 Tax=Marinobacter sp. MDS2 TaxID=3065961 RepID=UPI00273A7E31|nr:UDP-2,4-diacetamido-2,4,6-trideoxy-beta-L-altropyranose hydrolase [Marinobacter sp. MDS2]MDP4546837.1 UDP-2,4-diacetamido-2,4,6-trideoxy-beta-L-altropyranose hydrolase [Marinobacter sp. MDS2]